MYVVAERAAVGCDALTSEAIEYLRSSLFASETKNSAK
jgi:hypothetical protein